MFTVFVLTFCLILFLVERKLNARAGRKRPTQRPTRRVMSPRKR